MLGTTSVGLVPLGAHESFGGGGSSGAVGRADESDTALPLGSARPVGLAAETDTALALLAGVGLPFNASTYEFGQRTGLDIEDLFFFASTSINISVYADADVLLATQLFSYTETTGSNGRLTRKYHASLVSGTTYFFVARNADGTLSGCGRIAATS